MLHEILFFIFAAFCIGGAINLLVQKHPINSALSLIVVMCSLALIYLLLGAEFVAAIQVIVYAGAIMVLFVFVIMLLNAGIEEHTEGLHPVVTLGLLGSLILLGTVGYVLVVKHAPASVGIGQLYGGPKLIGRLLFRDFLLPFEVTSVLILIAIMGAVVLARKEEP